MAKKKTSKKKQHVPFEESLEQLRSIVSDLEGGNLPLSESLDKYAQGIQSLKRCHEALDAAQKKIEILVDLDSDGNLITRSFDDSASTTSGGVRRDISVSNDSTEDDLEAATDEEFGNELF